MPAHATSESRRPAAKCASQSARCVAAYLYAAAGAGESTTDLAWDGQASIFENGRTLAETERFPSTSQFALADIDLDMLRHELPAGGWVAIENMTWSPLHIVQRFQDQTATRPERLVLVGGASRSARPGRVRAFHWKGGQLPEQAVQDRIYEAVTGVIDIENTLVIGEYFGVWPQECFVVEADMPANTFGRLVIADSERWPPDL